MAAPILLILAIAYFGFSILIKAASTAAVLASLGIICLELPLLWSLRTSYESEYGDKIVCVIPGKIIWTIKTRWWTRRREFVCVQDVSAHADFLGFGYVVVKDSGRKHTLLWWITGDEAVRLADDIKAALAN